MYKVTAVFLAALWLPAAYAAEPDGESLVDPTAPLQISTTGDGPPASASRPGSGSFDVSSILVRGDTRIAIVNAQRVRVGDRVGSARVAAIESGSVTLEVGAETRTVQLRRNSVKTSRNTNDQP